MKLTRKLTAVATAVLLATAGCSVGSSSSGGQAGGGNQAFGANAELLPARQKAHDTMKGKKIAFVPILFKGYQLTENWGSTMKRTFESMGAQFTVYDSNFSSDRMLSTINDLIARKAADVLVLQNQDLGLLDNAIDRAEKAGIYTVVLNMMSTRLGDAFVGVDVYGAAQAIAKRAIADCDARHAAKTLSVIDGPGNDPASILWDQGIKDVAGSLGYQVLVGHSQFQNAQAQATAESVIQQQQGKLCGFLVTFDLNSITVGQTVKAAEGRGQVAPGSIGVYTLDADSNWCGALKQGLVTASAAYDVQGIGAAGAAAAQNLIFSGAKPGSGHDFAYVSSTVVDKTNVDQTTIACYKSQ
ncbi:sugar ABC transporter substrate-binding protein [Amycolatopsis australiensis]|uniref:Ribose transport system substrate-binding protein n=1 Tax=Amycolatopsis australiensis TaxID=546364 RepID=A0A1K1S729_9PSEU|nr:substrate-binding domain-containing protein [Amycolatopsis australiensis]SFW79821.1 ribose transport system substrate-binding protein [Amycolatopsis australiensis]